MPWIAAGADHAGADPGQRLKHTKLVGFKILIITYLFSRIKRACYNLLF